MKTDGPTDRIGDLQSRLHATKNVLKYITKLRSSQVLLDICQTLEMFANDTFPVRQRYCNNDRSPVMLPLLNSTTHFEQPLAAKRPLGEPPRVHLAAKRCLGFVVEFNNLNNYNITGHKPMSLAPLVRCDPSRSRYKCNCWVFKNDFLYNITD